MSWSDNEWGAFCHLLDEGYPGDFTAEAEKAWRVLLDDLPPAAAVLALKRLLHRGGTFRPSAAELIAEAHRDPSMPTFEEAWRVIRVSLKTRAGGMMGQTIQNQDAARAAAILRRLDGFHPAIRAFVERYGLDRLRMLPVEDPQWGEKHLRDLRDAWGRHCEASETRRVAALAAGRPDGLRQLDPLASIIGGRPALVGAEKGDEQ